VRPAGSKEPDIAGADCPHTKEEEGREKQHLFSPSLFSFLNTLGL
jgi:hypothetical protein